MSSHGSVSAAGNEIINSGSGCYSRLQLQIRWIFYIYIYIRGGARSTLEINLNTF